MPVDSPRGSSRSLRERALTIATFGLTDPQSVAPAALRVGLDGETGATGMSSRASGKLMGEADAAAVEE
jgi:hypothetical protein